MPDQHLNRSAPPPPQQQARTALRHGSGLLQKLCHRAVTVDHGEIQRSLPALGPSLPVRTLLKQQLDDFLITVLRRRMQWSPALLLPGVDVRAILDQHPRDRPVLTSHGRMNRGHLHRIVRGQVDIRALVDQELSNIGIPEKRSQCQRRKPVF